MRERGESADAATVERIPLFLETHPDVWAIVPDPVRLKSPVARPVLHVGQLRAVQRAAYFKPVARRRVFILDGAETMRWDHANIFLKILEEPPETATLILLATNPYALLPTIRSRCVQFFFPRWQTEAVEQILRDRARSAPAERKTRRATRRGQPGRGGVAGFGGSRPSCGGRSCGFWRRREVVPSAIYSRKPRSSRRGKKYRLKPCSNCSIVYSPTCWSFPPVAQNRELRNPIFGKELAALSRRVDPVWVAHAVQAPGRTFRRGCGAISTGSWVWTRWLCRLSDRNPEITRGSNRIGVT